MPVEFSECKIKKKYKHKRRNIPVFRFLILLALLFCAFKFGWVSSLVECLSSDKSENVPVQWDDHCRAVGGKPFELKGDLVQCSWMVNDASAFLPNPFLRYLASIGNTPSEKIHWVSSKNSFDRAVLAQREDSLTHSYFHIMREDSSFVWVEYRGDCTDNCVPCLFPGPCPVFPMVGSALSITENFDFEGHDDLLSTDVFCGAGETPIHPVLDGVVLAMGHDSLGNFIELDHGDNLVSRMAGMTAIEATEKFKVGDTVRVNENVGAMAPHDSAMFFLTIRQNGKFIRWNDFYKSTHPLSLQEIAKFKKRIGL